MSRLTGTLNAKALRAILDAEGDPTVTLDPSTDPPRVTVEDGLYEHRAPGVDVVWGEGS